MEEYLEAVIPVVLKQYKVPGLSISVVKDGQVILKKGYGVTDINSQENVTETTRFCIGSLTKAFTATVLIPLLQNQRGLTWDTPLAHYLGEEFCMDSVRTSEACLRDLLSHRMGIELGETDFGLMCGAMQRSDIHSKLKHIPIASGLRTKMMYNNFMYGLAGHVAEVLGKNSWENLVKELLNAIGMTETSFINQESPEFKNIAKPHMAAENDKLLQLDLDIQSQIGFCGAAGSLISSASDMALWMIFLLNNGTTKDGITLLSPHLLDDCFKPSFALPKGKPEWSGYVSRPDFPATETRDAYGFGWYMGTYREYRYFAHSGELFGFDSLLTLNRDMKFGIYTSMNGPAGESAMIANQLLHYYISDQLLGLIPWLDTSTICSFPEPWKPQAIYYPFRIHTAIQKDIPSTHPLELYEGKYSHPFLGDIRINAAQNKLEMKYGKLGHFHLYPNGLEDQFRIEGQGILSFLHKIDLCAPSDWMTVAFTGHGETMDLLCCALFESGPEFVKVT